MDIMIYYYNMFSTMFLIVIMIKEYEFIIYYYKMGSLINYENKYNY
jgi:hypothetical protein